MIDLQLDRCELLVREIEEDHDELGFIEQIMVDCDVESEDAKMIAHALGLQERAKAYFNENPHLAMCVRNK